jgi:hypothetical protein
VTTNVFVLGLDEENLETLQCLPDGEERAFHGLLTIDELQLGEDIPVLDLLEKAQQQLDGVDGSIDAIVGYWDFPVTLMVPILCERYGLPSSSLRSRLMCEHKYWSRLVQRQAAPEACVRFAPVDPYASNPRAGVDLDYPFWIKPVKSTSSMLAAKVESDDDFDRVIGRLREEVGRIGEPFEKILEMVDLPPAIAEVGGTACIAEEEAHGVQCTVEGYAHGGGVEAYGVVQSLHYPDVSSFYCYEYPSQLPDEVCERMTDVSRRVVSALGLEPSAFNIEFFWDERHDRVTILEINPRHSQSHAKLFELVDGLPNHKVMLDLALGREPSLPRGEGAFEIAGKWFVRRFADGEVRTVPSADDIAAIEDAMSGVTIALEVAPGDRLSELHNQDSYSYALAHLFIGAHDADELQRKYRQCVERLHFDIAP